jgi:5-methylcytosine-specific restriction protein A
MPKKNPKPCMAPQCSGLTLEKYCEQHKDKETVRDRERGTAADRGYGHKWRSARAGYLRKHPLSVRCSAERAVTAATVVDHIKPHQ